MELETIVFQVTTKCPYNCPQCYMKKNVGGDMALSRAQDVIDYALGHGLQAIQITGGEPVVYPHLSELMEYANKKGIYVFLATSGYGHSVEFYRSLKRSGLDVLCISINDIDEGINQLTRDSYGVSLAAIQDAVSAGLCCCANVVVSDDNIENFDVLSDYLRIKGVERVDILRPIKSFDGKYVPTVSDSTVIKINAVVAQDPDFFRVENCFKEYWECVSKKKFICNDAGDSSAFVNADGTFSPCSKLQGYKYSSIDEMLRSIDEWKGGCCG